MSSDARSATQVFREAQLGQLLDHEARIRELEAEVRALEEERARLREGGGTGELAALPGAAMAALLAVFDAVAIPDLSAFERQQALKRLSAALEELQAKGPAGGGLAAGTWSWAGGGREPKLQVAEGDGATVARVAREVVRVLGDVGGRYLAQMVEFQGTTPEQVSRARASQLVDASALEDTKAQFGLLPPERQRALFVQTVDQLIVARDQLHAARTGAAQVRQVLADLVARLGLPSPGREPSSLVLANAIAAQDVVARAPGVCDAVAGLVTRYASFLPDAGTLAAVGRAGAGSFHEGFAAALGGAVTESSEGQAALPLLAQALDAVLADHEALAEELREPSLDQRERAALKRLAASTTPAEARAALGRLAALAQPVEAAAQRQDDARRAVVKRFSRELEACARARVAASERPEAAAAAFEHLSKAERVAHLARLWRLLVADLRAGLEAEETGLDALEKRARAALVEAHGRSEPDGLEQRRREVDEVREALQRPHAPGEGELELATPIDVEQGLLARQAQDLAERVEAFMAKYSRSQRSGCQTLAETAATLETIEASGKGKRAGLDAIAVSKHKGKLVAAKEAAAAKALLAEQSDIDQALAALDGRKTAAFARERARLARLGLASLDGWDAAWTRLASERDRLARAAEACAARDAREQVVVAAARRLGASGDDVAAARALLRELAEEDRAFDRLAAALEAAHAGYLAEANAVLRKRAPDGAGARTLVDAVAAELAQVDALRAAAASWISGFAALRPELRKADKIREFVRRERNKARTLSAALDGNAVAVEKAVAALTRPSAE